MTARVRVVAGKGRARWPRLGGRADPADRSIWADRVSPELSCIRAGDGQQMATDGETHI